MCITVVAHFNSNIAAVHLVGYGGGSAGAEESIQHQITFVGGDLHDALNQAFRLGCVKRIFRPKQGDDFLLGFLVMPDLFVRPPSPRNDALCF